MSGSLLVGYVGLEQAVARLTAEIISDAEVYEVPRRQKPDNAEELNFAELAWAKRELAIRKLHAALCDGILIALVRDPASGALIRLTGLDWQAATFWRDIILGGSVRASAGEGIFVRYDGGYVLLEPHAFAAWLGMLAETQHEVPADGEARCLAWLEAEMRKSPKRKSQSKSWWRKEAKEKFSVSGRAFERQWAAAIENIHSNWGKQGAPRGPRKSKQIIEAPK
jgi:hypothetical protein